MVRQVGNPDHTLTRYWLARIKFELGQYRVARGYFQQALTAKEKSEKILCNDDPELLLYKYWLARAQFEIAAYPEAEKLLLQTLEGQERALEAASPDTRSSRYWLARTLFGLKRYSEAEKLLRPVLEEPPKDGSIGHEELLLLTKIRDLQSPNLLRQAKGHVETDLAASTSQMLVGNQHSLKKRDVVHDGQVHGPLLAPTTRAGRDISDRSLPLLDEGIISRPHTYALAIHTIPLLPKPFRSRDPSPATLSNRDSDMTLLTPKNHLLNRSKSHPSTPCKRKSLPERPKSALASIPQVGATVMDASSDTDR
jgi:tetratricopeptide (TPR) repeat protein